MSTIHDMTEPARQQSETKLSSTEDLSSRIQTRRRDLGWSLAEVAKRTGLSRGYINALELGKGKRPGADVIRRLEDVLGPIADVDRHLGDLPAGLAALARERNLPPSELRVLAALRIRGSQPASPERWRFIYDALLLSETMDSLDSTGSGSD